MMPTAPGTCAWATLPSTNGWGTSIYQLSGKKALANAERQRPPAWVRGQQQAPQVPLTRPVDRHDPREIDFDNRGRRNKKRASPGTDTTRNTMIDPRVVTDSVIRDELDAINRGDAIVDRQQGTAWINGRLWGYHTDTGRAFPIEGDGFVSMNAIQ